MTPDREKLVEENMGLARYFAERAACDPHDALSAAMAGLSRAAETYDPNISGSLGPGVPFVGYAGSCVRLRLLKVCSRAKNDRTHNFVRLDGLSEGDNTVEEFIVDEGQPVPGSYILVEELHEQVHRSLGVLDDRERYIVESYFEINDRAPKDTVELGRELGVSQARVAQVKSKALHKLRRELIPFYP